MTPEEENEQLKALLRKSLDTIRELNGRVRADPDASVGQPIAIVGTACELPGGAETPEAFWELLESGKTAERDTPAGVWRRTVYSRYFTDQPAAAGYAAANYLDRDITRFDPRFFNISPTEASDMDPTQRLALELTTQALERAGYNPWRMPGTVGVYFGVIGGEYGALARQSSRSGGYVATGTLDSMVSGRISHTFDFTGPSVSVDTACSSSLVALHLACEGIRNGDCDAAVVGGVNLLLDPSVVTALADFGALSIDGRCRPFTGDGEGYGRGEGGAVVVLKRLDNARRDRDQVLATVLGTAVNHDGRCSGVTVPSGKAQQRLLATALRRSGLRGADVDYLEAHGTGTPLGDPIEMSAAGAVYGRGRPADRPLIVASNKAQIGHLEAASGIASLLKVVLALQHGRIPAQACVDTLSPHIDFDRLALQVPRAAVDLGSRRMVAAVSSFGFSGTNAHAILTSPDDAASPPEPDTGRRHALVLSARSPAALAATVDAAVGYLQAPTHFSVGDICFTYATGRAHGAYRTYVTGRDRCELLRALRVLAATPQHVSRSRLTRTGPVHAAFFVAGLIPTLPDPRAGEWYRRYAGFRRGFDRVALAWAARTGTTLPRRDGRAATIVELACHQLAVLCGSIDMLRSLGVEPHLWCPEGVGVYAVALRTGARDVEAIIAELIELFTDVQLDDPQLLTSTPYGLPALRVPTSTPRAPTELPPVRFDAAVICPETADFLGPRHLRDADYWRRAAACRSDPTRSAAMCVEHNAPIAILLGFGTTPAELIDTLQVVDLSAVPDAGGAAVPDRGDAADDVLSLLLRMYELGAEVDWAEWYADCAVGRATVPTSVLEPAPYALELVPRTGDGAPLSHDPLEPRLHPSPRGSDFEFRLAAAALPVADTHGIVHIGYFVEMLLRALAQARPEATFEIGEMTFATALVLAEQPAQLRLVFDGLDSDGPAFTFHALIDVDGNRWQRHVSGTLLRRAEIPSTTVDLAVWSNTGPQCGGDGFYEEMGRRGLRLGPSVRAVGEVRRRHESVCATVDAAHGVRAEYAARVAPGLLDACAQVFHTLMPDTVPATAAFMVERLEGLIVCPGKPVAPHAVLLDQVRLVPDTASVTGRFALVAEDGTVILECRSCTIRWIESGIDSVVTALGSRADQPRITAEEAATAAASNDDASPLDAAVRRVVAELTGVAADDIAVSDTTTDLGIDSIQATRLYRALEPVNPHDRVTLADLVRGVTIAELAARLTPESAVRPSPPPSQENPAATQAASSTALDNSASASESSAARQQASKPVGRYIQPRDGSAESRLLCVPYGGGSTLLYRSWQQGLPDGVEVCPVALPGRGTRLDEPLIPDVYRIVTELEAEVLSKCDRPFDLYGHSSGALISYLLAVRLQAAGHPGPRRLYLAAFSSPAAAGNPFHRDCHAELRAAGYPEFPTAGRIDEMPQPQLRRLAAVLRFPAADTTDPAFLRMALPILANDIRMVGSFRHGDGAVLGVPIIALHGCRDDRVTECQMRDWAHWTTSSCLVHVLDGDHYFLHPDQCRDQVLDIIAKGDR